MRGLDGTERDEKEVVEQVQEDKEKFPEAVGGGEEGGQGHLPEGQEEGEDDW